jgi:hypothetical protein
MPQTRSRVRVFPVAVGALFALAVVGRVEPAEEPG